MTLDPKHLKVCMYHPLKGAVLYDPAQIKDLDEDWRDSPYSEKEIAEWVLATKKKPIKKEKTVIVEEEDDEEALLDEEKDEPASAVPVAPTRIQFSSQKEFDKALKAFNKKNK